ncbi:MAG: endonuclease/exonuclease/phosphatase family protein, partial [Polyangia bacterium]
MDILRVVTLNIWNNQGPWPERLRLIRRELPTLQADLVGLQEVLHLEAGGTPDQAQAIADGLGYYTAFASAWHIGGGLQFGNALLSRHPIVTAKAFMLPCEEGDETRALLYCCVDAPCGKIPVFVTHLSWKLHQSDIRQQQVAFIAARIKELAPVDQLGFPPVLMGDFNAEPESDEI